MDVDWIRFIVEIARLIVLREEVAPVELKTRQDMPLELIRGEIAAQIAKGAQIVACVKVVDPLLRVELAIWPRTVFALAASR